MTKLYHIKIFQCVTSPAETELFSVLAQLLPIKFIFGEQEAMKAEGLIASAGSVPKNSAGIPSLSLPSVVDPTDKQQRIETDVLFTDDPDVPFPFRGRRLRVKLPSAEPVLTVQAHEKVLAATQWGPVWSVSEIGGAKHFNSALPLPIITAEQNFNDVFNGECFLEMLVVLQFAREVIANTAYQLPPLRASFIIDDPNLHWPRYGFVDYREIAAHAQTHNYHVSFATIPLDAWFTQSATARLFRVNSQQLSLLIHGNNHAKGELARNYSKTQRISLLQQAIRRIGHLEQKADLRVCRVMVPPHGACSDEMLAELPENGFEATCISTGSLRAHNPDKPWTKTLGFFPAEIIRGCPVLPRWGLTGNVKNSLLLAAYLGQPLILRGHHQDFKEGAVIFDDYAQFINGLGAVFWSNMTDLSRLNYLWRLEGATCYIKPLGRKVAFELPAEATAIVIESPDAIDDCTWQAVSADGCVYPIMPCKPFPLSAEMGLKINIECAAIPPHPSVALNLRPTAATLVLRRLLTEARDRLLIA